jgi:hypothetical protein
MIPNHDLLHGEPKWTLAIFEVQLGVPIGADEMDLPGATIVNGQHCYPEHENGQIKTRRITFNYNPAAAQLLNPNDEAVLAAAFRAARGKAQREAKNDGATTLTRFVNMGVRFVSRRLIENKIPAS